LNLFELFSVIPDHRASELIAKRIWDFAQKTHRRPLIITTTAGPAISLRRELERNRPKNLPDELVFLPEIYGLSEWLEQAPDLIKLPRESNLKRWSQVYHALEDWPQIRQQLGALGESGKWALAQAIVQACDKLSTSTELVRYQQSQIDQLDFEELSSQLESHFQAAMDLAYPDFAGQMLSLDGRLILAFWKNLSSISDSQIRQQLAFKSHLESASQPMVWISTAEVFGASALVQQNFLKEYVQYQSLLKIDMDWHESAVWPEAFPIKLDQRTQLLENGLLSFSEEHVEKSLTNRGEFHSPNWHLIGCKRFEDVAQAAAMRIQEHFINGRKNIALIAQDRLVSRRIRALISRLGPGISVSDSTGWKLSTTQSAAAIHSWLDVIRQASGPSLKDLLTFLKNPLIDFYSLYEQIGISSESIQEINFHEFLWRLEQLFIGQDARSGWQAYQRCFEDIRDDSLSPDGFQGLYVQLIQVLMQRATVWHRSTRSATQWCELFVQDLEVLGMLKAAQEDDAGHQLLLALKEIGRVGDQALTMNSWIALLESWLEQTSYVEVGEPGQFKLSIFPLSGIRLRTFDAVIMVGCDDRQLPSLSESGLFFSQAFTRSLGIPGIEEEFLQQARDLSQLLISHHFVDFYWQELGQGDAMNRPAGWLTRLMDKSESGLSQNHQIPVEKVTASPCKPAYAIWDRASYSLPRVISPSGYKALRNCPYQFYVSRLLGLREPRAFDEDRGASLIGQLLHRTLRVFYQQLKTQDLKAQSSIQSWSYDERRHWMTERLRGLSDSTFESFVQSDGRFLGALIAWKKQIPSWIEWQLTREQEGWRFHDAECKVGVDIDLSNGIQVRIEGYVDRIDMHEKSGAAILDYKLQTPQLLKKKVDHVFDDPQLLMYAHAADHSSDLPNQVVTQLLWVSLKTKDVDKKTNPERSVYLENIEQQKEEWLSQFVGDLQGVWSGKPLHAYAPDSVCQYCDARGICRKGMWS